MATFSDAFPGKLTKSQLKLQTNKQAERIIYLSVKKEFLACFRMFADILKKMVKLFVSLFLVFQLLQFHFADPLEQRSIVCNEVCEVTIWHFTRLSTSSRVSLNMKSSGNRLAFLLTQKIP